MPWAENAKQINPMKPAKANMPGFRRELRISCSAIILLFTPSMTKVVGSSNIGILLLLLKIELNFLLNR
jgi:hypothetical protein